MSPAERGSPNKELAQVVVEDDKYLGRSPEQADGGEMEEGQGPRALQRGLKSRHMQMIALGGAIGSGLFVGVGSALQSGGPGGLFLAMLITGVMTMCMTQALAELSCLYPINGAFFTYTCRFIDPAWGFANGWIYAFSWLFTLPFDLIAAGLTIQYWNTSIDQAVWVTVFLVPICVVQFFGVRGYGEIEFVLAMVKTIAIIGFIILGIIIDTGGVPTDDRGYIGFRYWNEPGAFKNGFAGFCSVFLTAAFSYGGTEYVGLAAAETINPQKEVPRAAKHVFWRILIFYVLSCLMVGLCVPSDLPQLLNASSSDTKDSPFVLAMTLAGIKVLPSIFNAVIMITVVSVGNSCTFGSTRTMQALAMRGMAPKFLEYVDKKGRPVWCLIIQLLFGCLAYLADASSGQTVFNWLLAISGLSAFFNWGSICGSHLRFRRAWRAQGHTLDELPYRSTFGLTGSWIGLVMCVLCVMATFYNALWPGGELGDAYNFFVNFVSAPLALCLFLFWKIWSRRWAFFVRTQDMDLDTGRAHKREHTEDEEEDNIDVGSRLKRLQRSVGRLLWG